MLTERVLELVTASRAQVELFSTAYSRSQFVRGDTHVAGQASEVTARLTVEVNGRHGRVATNQIDDVGLRALVTEAATVADANPTIEEWEVPRPQTVPEGPQIAFDTNLEAMAPDRQATLVHDAAEAAEAAGLIAAGDLHLEATSQSVRNTEGLFIRATAPSGLPPSRRGLGLFAFDRGRSSLARECTLYGAGTSRQRKRIVACHHGNAIAVLDTSHGTAGGRYNDARTRTTSVSGR